MAEETKEKAKEETKEETKEKAKEETKEETKEKAKEETKPQPSKKIEKKEETHSLKEEKLEKKETKITHLTQKSEDIIKTVESMSVLELSNLVKALEEKFGVSAQAPVVAATTTQAVSETVKPEEEEKNTFDIVLKEIGPKKIQVIKEIRAITTLGLKEAKDLVEQAPKTVKQEVSKQEAEEIKKKIEQTGAKVELK